MSRAARLFTVLAANLALVGALVGIGAAAHSLGLWAEGIDDLADAAAIGVALLAMRLQRASTRRPNGVSKATRYAALVNAGWLLVLTALVAAGALDRLVSGAHRVRGLPVLIASAVAALTMGAGALVLGGDLDDEDDEDAGGKLSMRAVLLDTVGDAAAAAGVAGAGGVIVATGGQYWLDPAVALLISVVVGYHALRLLGKVRSALRT
ncbi:MAG: cation diffusion facilitator family transporter [Actinomycetota bacterium]|nr:cation diffusion facilitator family transporter [Actinomycetota bacterium]